MRFLLSLLSSPATGDNRNVVLYGVLAAVAAVLIIVFILLGRKNKKK